MLTECFRKIAEVKATQFGQVVALATNMFAPQLATYPTVSIAGSKPKTPNLKMKKRKPTNTSEFPGVSGTKANSLTATISLPMTEAKKEEAKKELAEVDTAIHEGEQAADKLKKLNSRKRGLEKQLRATKWGRKSLGTFKTEYEASRVYSTYMECTEVILLLSYSILFYSVLSLFDISCRVNTPLSTPMNTRRAWLQRGTR